ncbi:MAG: hypothetical protein M3O71_27830 [Bacteroidota bacterium]|nr:hypothetical protein [Bacteroidota bacterium]
MKRKRIYFFILICLVPVIVIYFQSLGTEEKADARGDLYVGSQKCIKCHSAEYKSYLLTGHHQASMPAAADNIHGSFAASSNSFSLSENSKAVMEKRGNSFFQVAYNDGKEARAERFDITFGGVKAETYGYWKGSKVFELPMSYFNAKQSWTNSPGYNTRHPYFDRPITQRCFECHSSYIASLPITNLQEQEPGFDKNSLVYGVDCERCHGPAANHVNFHTENPGEKTAKYIAKFASLTRAQKLDACSVCHGGGKDIYLESPFKFRMGDTLAKFKEPSFAKEDPNPATIDVHGNQRGLLATSKCFLMSNMDCSNCHNIHVNETAKLVAYSQRCMKCHNEANHNFCTMAPKLGLTIKNNCIDCHMPEKPSNLISIAAAGGKKEVPYLVRTHRIAIYPEESKKILAFINDKKIGN